MSAPNDGYGQHNQKPQPPYADQPQDGCDAQAPQPAAADHGKKKNKADATHAYEFGTGANFTAAGAPMQGSGGMYGMPQPQTPAYESYSLQDA
ncbi:protein transport protein [Colletotrichum sojae]|uniref:Protein transport protein n=1 Tax=Colletotrichum sojae TaxID=2175907 RepID=A0A8H6ILA4_9PEZI|nr:protein transport protein [Colletotrichum sojae]